MKPIGVTWFHLFKAGRWLRLLSVLRSCSVAVDLLFILLPLISGVLCLVLILLLSTLNPYSYAIISMGKKRERAGCFGVTVCLMSYDSQCCVALPRDAVGWSAVCDCGIS